MPKQNNLLQDTLLVLKTENNRENLQIIIIKGIKGLQHQTKKIWQRLRF